MKKKIVLVFIVSSLFLSIKLKADEGMWLPLLISRLNYVDMQKMGCHLTADEIYSANHSSIKDAIVSLNNGDCSGVMVSSEGLLFTAHHCGEDFVQSHSSVEMDYITYGFWARDKIEELRNDKLSATFLVRIEDVSGKILPYVNDNMTEAKRQAVIDSISTVLENAAVKGTTYDGKVLSFFEGNEYYMFVTETYKDVRLVGTPPQAIGDFGADTDNWVWPRHAGEFSIFRVYMSPDGKPASYSKKNIPYKPKHFLPVSLKGAKKDDFAMILGYPYSTDRFMTSYGLKVNADEYNESYIKIHKEILSLIDEDMKASEDVKVKYISKYYNISNYYKYYIGQNEQLKNRNIYDKKVALEKAFTTWYNSDPKLKKKYDSVLSDVAKADEIIGKYTLASTYFEEAIFEGLEIISFANTYEKLYKQLKLGASADSINLLTQSLTYAAKLYFKNYNMATDKKICVAMFEMFFADVPKEFYPDIFETIQKKYKGDIATYVNKMYEQSIFVNKDKIFDFLTKPDYKKLDKDIGYITMESFYKRYYEVLDMYKVSDPLVARAKRLFIEGIMEMNKNKNYYPDANATMRLTYGKVTDYSPNAATKFNYYTTLDELMAKEDPKNSDFTVPDKLKQLYQNKDYGKYTTDGKMHVCFITNNDIAGGVSGSPVINGDGELTGIVFDMNWESTSSDLFFDENYQRTINVDIKYVLFIIDKYAGATNIIKELTLKE
jgi:hypothetical protein